MSTATATAIRPAEPADADAVVTLAHALAGLPLLVRYGVTGAGLGAELRRVALSRTETAPRQRLLLAERSAAGPEAGPDANSSAETGAEAGPRDARLCGLARVQLDGQFGQGGYLKLIALLPGHEGRGLGAALLRAVEREVLLASQNLFLLTSDFNVGAQRFYQREGYELVGRLPDFARPGIAELVYWKRLR